MSSFIFNDCDVCMNADIIFSNEDKGWGLAWRYVEIRVCEWDGMWDWGFTGIAGGSPCMKKGNHTSREEAVEVVVEYMKEHCQKRVKGRLDENNGAQDVACAKDFLYWVSLRKQLALF